MNMSGDNVIDFITSESLKKQYLEILIDKTDIGVVQCEVNPTLSVKVANEYFYRMINVEKNAFDELYHGSFMEIVNNTDRLDFKQKIKKSAKKGTDIEAEIHLKRGDHDRFLVHFQGIYVQDPDTESDYIVAIIKDIDHLKKVEKELKFQSVRYHVLKKITNEPVFEYDDLSDTMVISFNGEDRDSSIIHNFRSELRNSGYVAPEDVERFLKAFDESLNLDELSIQELRTNIFDGEYVWYRAVYTTIVDTDSGIRKLIGKMENINSTKVKQMELLRKSMYDPLTKLYNRVTARHYIDEFLSKLPDSQHALMIVDIDNFKMVNDNLGHLFGDTVLTNFSEQLSSIFSEDEVVGRIGGDEFMVFLPEVSEEEIRHKGELACKIFEHVYSGNLSEINVSTSIGVSVYPNDGSDYESLFRAADQALYVSKQNGKNQYNFYSTEFEDVLASDEQSLGEHYKMENTRENRNNQATRDMIEFAFHILTETKDVESGIGLVLESLCKRLDIQCGMLYEERVVGDGVTLSFFWDKVHGLITNTSARTLNLRDWAELSTIFAENAQCLVDDIDTVKNVPNFYEYLESIEAGSFLAEAIKDDGDIDGALILISKGGGDVFGSDEKNMVRVIVKIITSYLLQIRYNERVNRKIDRLTNYDVVTGRYHFDKFKSVLREILDWDDVDDDQQFVIFYTDISGFKNINDIYGYAIGDQVLYELSELIRKWKGFVIGCRDYADHFVTLVKTKKSVDPEDLVKQMNAQFQEKQTRFIRHALSLSTGAYIINDFSENVSQMIDKANIARKYVKKRAHHEFKIYDTTLDERHRKSQVIEDTMENALQHGEFKVFMQPKYDLKTGKIVAAEALTRWQKPDKGFMFPDDFIPVFEQNGFITQVDFYVLEVVCKTLRERIREHQPNVNISINQSRYLLHDEQYISKIEHMMDRYNVPPELLEFELTESLFFEDSKAMIDIMHQLKQLNLQVSIDDFGSGYSSLNVLKDVPADVIKLDKEFLNEKESSKESEIIIQKTVEMAKELNKRVICEGVETIEQVEFLKSIGCDMVQGFYYAKPMPMDEFFERLESEM